MIILTEKEKNVLFNPSDYLNETDILRDLKSYWLINATFAGTAWCIYACINSAGKQFLRSNDKTSILDKMNVELDLGIVKISNK